MTQRQLVLFSGSGWNYDGPSKGRVFDDWLIGLTGKIRPRVCLIGTAQGDQDRHVARFMESMGDRCEVTHAPLFQQLANGISIEDRILESDLVYIIGGWAQGNVAAWRAAGWDSVLNRAWSQGIVIAGLSAGAMSLVSQYTNQWLRKPLIGEGLGLLPISFCAHFNHDIFRDTAQLYKHAVADGLFVPGYGLEDGMVLRFVDEELTEIVRTRQETQGWKFSTKKQDEEPLEEAINKIITHDKLVVEEITGDFLPDRLRDDGEEISWEERLERLQTAL